MVVVGFHPVATRLRFMIVGHETPTYHHTKGSLQSDHSILEQEAVDVGQERLAHLQ